MAHTVLAAVLLLVVCSTISAELRVTPFGEIDSSCLHEVPSNSEIFHEDGATFVRTPDGTIRKIPRCQYSRSARNPSVAHGWQAWTTFQYSAGIDNFLGTFDVPDSPEEEPGIIYIFTGLQNIDWIPEPDTPPPSGPFDIIQPVLEYTNGRWSVRSWYVTLDEGYLYSHTLFVQPGQHIFGNMTKTGEQDWFIGSKVVETGQSTNLLVSRPRLQTQPWAYTALEVYSVHKCAQYPHHPLHFTEMSLMAGGSVLTPKWATHQGVKPACKERAVVNSPSNVTIFFGNEN